MKINELLQNLQLNWQEELQKDEWFFAKERDKINNSFTAEESFNAIMEVVFFIQSEINIYLCTELINILYLLIPKSDTTEIPKGFVTNLQVLKRKLAKDMYSLNIIKEIESYYRIFMET